MMQKDPSLCLCCSGKTYASCCEPLHKGQRANNALELMRSRYCAYALNIPSYIIKTTHPASSSYESDHSQWKKELSAFFRNYRFEKLVIHEFKENAQVATVTFTAHIFKGSGDASFTEKSYFEKREGAWLYRTGFLQEGHLPQLATLHPLKILPLAYYGDPILRKKAAPVESITPEILNLIEEMIDTMDAYYGIGIAAPQTHHSLQIFVIRPPLDKTSLSRECEKGAPKVFINPKISSLSKETFTDLEGCLSIPGIRGSVERPLELTIEYMNLDGQIITEKISGYQTRMILHENDHLQGVLFIDRLSKAEQLELKSTLRHFERRIRDGKTL